MHSLKYIPQKLYKLAFKIRSHILISTCLLSHRQGGKGTRRPGSLLFLVTVWWFMISKPENLGSHGTWKEWKIFQVKRKKGDDLVAQCALLRLKHDSESCHEYASHGPSQTKRVILSSYSPTLLGKRDSFVIIKGMLTDLKWDYTLLYSSELKICFGDHS